LYLPHLRNAVFEHLIAADNLIERLLERAEGWVEITSDDFDLDARQEIRIAGDRLIGYLAPARGGHLYELDIRATRHNLLATLDRRPEPYHATVRDKAGQAGDGENNAESIHDAVRFKQPGLDKKLIYDGWARKSLVDHFLQPGLDLEEFRLGHGVVGDFTTGVYETVLRRSAGRGEVRMSRQGNVGPYVVHLVKTVALDTRQGGRLETHYELAGLPPGLPMHFAVEFNFAGMAACQPDRYFYDATGTQLGSLETIQNLTEVERVGLVDEWLGLDTALEFSEPADVWAFPIETVSQSEGGFELVHQSTAVVPRWTIHADEDGRFEVSIALEIDTSAAQARALRETATAR
jgi:alpha-amylase